MAMPGSKAAKPTRSSENFLVFGSPLICADEKQEVLDCWDTGWLGTGPKVAQFERELRDYKAAQHAIAVNSCTAALHLSLIAAGVGPGDEVITTPMTFCATVNAIIHAGARPVLADVETSTMNIDPHQLEARITGQKKALLVVHFAARPCRMYALTPIQDLHGLGLIRH